MDDGHAGIRDAGPGIRRFLKPAAPDDDSHPESLGTTRHFPADVAVAENAKRPSEQSAPLRVLLLVPLSRSQIGDVLRDAPIEREDQRERQLRNRNRVLPGTI